MLETSGRKLFRPPFALSQLPHILNGDHVPSDNTKSIADIETRKHPTAPLMPPQQAIPSLADVETRKHPTAPLQHSGIVPPQKLSGPVPPQKFKHTPLSPHKKKLLIVLLIASLLPSLIVIFELINGVVFYKQAQNGIAHLQAIPPLFHGSDNSGPGKYFDQHKLRLAQAEIENAHADFVSLSTSIDNNSVISLTSAIDPTQIRTARALGHIAVDGTSVADQLIKVAIDIAPNVSSALTQTPNQPDTVPLKPFINATSFQEINTTLGTITPLVHAMNIEAQQLSLNALPISTKQRELVLSILPLLPILDASLTQKQQWINMVGWFLGIASPRAFLVEPMDSSELRATGGFTGQFADLTLNGGHMGPLKFSNIGKYEESHQDSPPDPVVYAKVSGQPAPDPYSAWWPIPNFGLRDANLSADFPTSARIAMDHYTYEFGNHVDGVIIFTPSLIQQVLHVTGPITIPAYGEIITEQNLQARLHYYQLDNRGIRREEIIEKVEDPQVARKLFTQRVTTGLLSSVTHLPINKLLPMANELLQSMKTKDLQIYVTNPQLEALIGKYGSTAALDRSTTHDGLFIVQSNLSASKASQYVTTSIKDTIALDSKGGATHNLHMTLDYQQKGDVYGLDTYRDYIRIYTPIISSSFQETASIKAESRIVGINNQGMFSASLMSMGTSLLSALHRSRDRAYATQYLSGDDPTEMDWSGPLEYGPEPTDRQSDETGRAMFAGWVIIPKNCTMKVTPLVVRTSYEQAAISSLAGSGQRLCPS